MGDGGSCSAAYAGLSPSSSSEHLLLQHVFGLSAVEASPDLVVDESGFSGGDELDDIAETGCASSDVRRRRREGSMCSCRRRDSGMRYDGGWRCQGDLMVQEEPEFNN